MTGHVDLDILSWAISYILALGYNGSTGLSVSLFQGTIIVPGNRVELQIKSL